MSTEETADRFLAKLVRGGVYYLGPIRFDRGAYVVIDAHHKDHLAENAADKVADEDGDTRVKHSFKYEAYAGDEPVGTVVEWDENLRLEDAESSNDTERLARMRSFRAKEDARLGKKPAAPARFREEPTEEDVEPAPALSVIEHPARTPVTNELTAAAAPTTARTRTRVRA